MWRPWRTDSSSQAQAKQESDAGPPSASASIPSIRRDPERMDKSAQRANHADDGDAAAASEVIRRPPFVGIAAGLFLLSFTGAAVYGVRAGRRAQMKEAAEAAEEVLRAEQRAGVEQHRPTAVAAATATATIPKSASRPVGGSSRSSKLDWGAAGTSAPFVLSRRSGSANAVSPPRSSAAHEQHTPSSPSSSSSSSPTSPPPPMGESPALTAIKAFGVATALVAVTTAVAIEIGRRVYDIEDMYDLTDRLHARIPKTFAVFESLGAYFRDKLDGVIPKPAEDQRDPLKEDVDAVPAAAVTSSSPPPVDDLLEEIAQADGVRRKMELLEVHLQREKTVQDRIRQRAREQREEAKQGREGLAAAAQGGL